MCRVIATTVLGTHRACLRRAHHESLALDKHCACTYFSERDCAHNIMCTLYMKSYVCIHEQYYAYIDGSCVYLLYPDVVFSPIVTTVFFFHSHPLGYSLHCRLCCTMRHSWKGVGMFQLLYLLGSLFNETKHNYRYYVIKLIVYPRQACFHWCRWRENCWESIFQV